MRKTLMKIRKTHRYLGVFIGLQFLAWTISGLYFSWTDLDEIHGDQYQILPPPATAFKNLIDLDSLAVPIKQVRIVEIGGNPYYWVNSAKLFDARSGVLKQGIDQAEAMAVANQYMKADLVISKVEKIEAVDAHSEIRGRPLPVYGVHYDHPDKLIAYVDGRSGIFQRVRHESWRWFDFLWMSHTMDYQGRDDFNNILLRIFSLFGLFTVLSGFLLWGTTSPTLRKLKFKK